MIGRVNMKGRQPKFDIYSATVACAQSVVKMSRPLIAPQSPISIPPPGLELGLIESPPKMHSEVEVGVAPVVDRFDISRLGAKGRLCFHTHGFV